jgi:hypothetical protein
MPDERWTWDAQEHPGVAEVLAAPANDLEWCGRLENAPSEAIIGKVLCVCAAAAIAREVVEAHSAATPLGIEALELLGRWIDDPTDERFERICALLFGEHKRTDLDSFSIVGWALRTATSSVGNYEAGWAFEATCKTAVTAGFNPERLRQIAEREVLSRASS